MINRLKQLIRHSAVYSINSITEKAVGVILIPLMTFYFTKGEFGNWDILDQSIVIMADILLFGLATVVVFFNNPEEFPYEKKSSFFTLTLFIAFLSIVFILIVEAVLTFGIFPVKIRENIAEIIRITTYIIALRALANFLFGKLRADERSIKYTVVYSIKLFIRTSLTVYFILFTDKKWEGVFYSSLIAEISAFIILMPVLVKNSTAKLNFPALKTSVKIGGALVLSTIGFNILNLSDRYIIKFLIGEDYVGLYGLGYRTAGILNMFLILPFTLTLLPATYKIYKQKDDKRYFSKLMTYSTFFFVWGFIALSLFSPEIVKIFGQKIVANTRDFNLAFMVVPLILLGYVFSGMRLTAALGMMLTRNTKWVGITTLISAAVNVILNFIFIPVFGIMAAAFNTLISYILFYILTLLKSNQYYDIPYEKGKLFLLIIAGSVFASVIYFFPSINLFQSVLLKLVIIISFPFIIYFFNFYEKAELDILLNRKKLFEFAKSIFIKNDDNKRIDDINTQ